MANSKKTCIIVCGPTAVGKTGVAIQLAKALHTEIISADSRQCYRELNIGVAKPSDEELNSIPHFFINSHSIQDQINVADFERYADAAAAEIFSTNDFVVMVGGTGMYINAFCNGLDEITGIDPLLRKRIRKDYQEKGLEWLRSAIGQLDTDFNDLDNPQRMMRALEVVESTGRSIRSFQTTPIKTHEFNIIKLGLELPRDLLYQTINLRVDKMMESGLLNEVEGLLPFKNLNALNTVGYKELFAVLQGEISLGDSVNLIKQNTRHYAKRQLTWFKRDLETMWFSPADIAGIKQYCLKTATN